MSGSTLPELECQFIRSCMAVTEFGIDLRRLRSSIVSNLMRSLTDLNKARKTIGTKEVGCQHKPVVVLTKEVGCQKHKGIKMKNAACQFRGLKVLTRDVGCQQGEDKVLTKDVGCQHNRDKFKPDNFKSTKTATRARRSQPFSLSSKDNEKTNQCISISSVGQASLPGVWSSQEQPHLHVHVVGDLQSNSEVSPEIPRQDSLNFTFAKTSSKKIESSSIKSTKKATRARRSQPVCLARSLQENGMAKYETAVSSQKDQCGFPGPSNTDISPEIPRQDSIKLAQAKNSSKVPEMSVKRKSMRLYLRRLENNELTHLTVSKNPQSVVTEGTHMNQDAFTVPTKTHKGVATRSCKRLRSRDEVMQSLPAKGALDMGVVRDVSLAKVELDTRFQPTLPPIKRRKTLVGNRKFEAFKLSVVDNKEYADRSSTIRMDTSVLVPPRLL